MAVGSQERHELHDHNQRPRRRLGHAQTIEHLGGENPVVNIDRLLLDIGE